MTIFRVLNDVDDTVRLAEEFQAIGVKAITVHGRKIHERPQHSNNTGKFQNNNKKLENYHFLFCIGSP